MRVYLEKVVLKKRKSELRRGIHFFRTLPLYYPMQVFKKRNASGTSLSFLEKRVEKVTQDKNFSFFRKMKRVKENLFIFDKVFIFKKVFYNKINL